MHDNKPIYSPEERALIEMLEGEISQQHDWLEANKDTAPEHEVKKAKSKLIINLKRFNAVLDQKPVDFITQVINKTA